eukprot:m.33922 g.33922  ORF g.33922 m.33922 type:complete len:331 (+) comp8626_c0_seq2:312-1304(+)
MADFHVDVDMQKEIHDSLLEKELHRHRYRGLSPYLAKRAEFVDWIHDVAEKFQLRYTSASSAVAYFDLVMDYYKDSINFFELQVLGMACLMVAAKMEEQEPDIPLLPHVIRTAGLKCTVEQLNAAELLVLKAWNWNVCVVTPNHFVDLYARESAMDDIVSGRSQAIEHIDKISEYAIEAARIACKDISLLQFRPSVVATATVVCARTLLNCEPHYPASLMALSSPKTDTVGTSELAICCEMLLRLCATDKLPQSVQAMEGVSHSLTSPDPAATRYETVVPRSQETPMRLPLQNIRDDSRKTQQTQSSCASSAQDGMRFRRGTNQTQAWRS